MKKKRILVLDAGGIRGLATLKIMQNFEKLLIEEGHSGYIGDYFDMIVGTSTGGIITAMYLHPHINYKSSDILDFYFNEADNMFSRNLWYKLKSLFGVIKPKYNSENKNKTISKYFGGIELKDLKKPCIITAYDIHNNKAVLFKQHKADKASSNFMVDDIINGTVAAPTYFNSHKLRSFSGKYYNIVDGGVINPNCSVIAYTEMNKLFKDCDASILSIGTGNNTKIVDTSKVSNGGIFYWGKPISSLMLECGKEIAEYQCMKIMNENYTRVDDFMPLDMNNEMDCIEFDNMKKLVEFGNSIFLKNEDKLRNYIKKF